MNQELANVPLWSEEKRLRLQAQLTGMWAEDSWLVPGTNEKGEQVQRSLC